MQLTFITAVAPYHAHLISAVRAQVDRQTIPCAHRIIEDTAGRGPGWARNAGLEQTASPFVAFLDADDQIASTWAAETMAAFEAHGGRRYIYTDHVLDDRIVAAPECAWVGGTWHVITALIPTTWAKRAGGFDESLPAFEDTEFYLRLNAHGHCGARLARPLFRYGAGGRRSRAHHATPVEGAARRYFSRQYGGRTVGCCGEITTPAGPTNERQDGDILAEALWAGNRIERGMSTGRLYPRASIGDRLWVNEADVKARPNLWRAVQAAETNTIAPDFDFASFADYAAQTGDNGGPLVGIEAISDFIMREQTPPAEYEPPPPAIQTDTAPAADKPSAATLRAKAAAGRQRRGGQPPRVMEA